MIKQLVVVGGVLLTLSAALAETVLTDTPTKTSASVTATSTDVSSRATVQFASIWVEHSKANTSTQLARPL